MTELFITLALIGATAAAFIGVIGFARAVIERVCDDD